MCDGEMPMQASYGKPGMAPLQVEKMRVALPGFDLCDVSVDICPGRITALLGHNGAGKTTSLRTIMGLVRQDGGRIRFQDGTSLEAEKAFRERIGYVPEEGFYYRQFTIGELIAFTSQFYAGWNPAACERLLAALDLDRHKRIGTLSKGMRMKTGILLAFAHEPSVLLLDEPTSGLDPRSRSEVVKLIRGARQEGRGVLLATHNLAEVEQLADHVMILDHGHVLVDESMAALRARSQREREWSLERFYLELVK
jgi:ABC-2 type transport system ATP-binding protein